MTTTPSIDQDQDSAAKARRAADDLAAEGRPVTARAVRERARVRMTVAAQAVREHTEAAEAAGQVPAVPDVVAGRIAAIWREAVVLARAEHAEAAAGWAQRIEDLATELDEVRADLAAAEAAQGDLAADVERVRAELTATRAQARADAERASEGHTQEVAELRDALNGARREAAAETARAAAAEARAETLQAVLDRIQPPSAKQTQ